MKFIRKGRFKDPTALKRIFRSVDLVPIRRGNKTVTYYVFNIGGNKYRLIAAIHFNTQLLYVRDILTHQEYDAGKWKKMKARNIARNITEPEDLGLFVVPRNEREYDAAVQRLGELMDEIGDNSKNRRYRLIETLSALIEAYDRGHHQIPDVSGADMLRFLIEQHGLTHRDLPEIGSARAVSEILRGRRELNMRQLMALAKRFGVPPAAFLPERA